MKIINEFKKYKDESNSEYMNNYMKNKFDFIGIKSPLRKELQKEFFKEFDKNSPIDKDLVIRLWNEEYRELQYLATDYLVKNKKKLQKEDMEFIRNLIVTKSWWDSVDMLASHLVGELCKKYPELIDMYILKWSKDENVWLRRTSIIYQLKYKGDIDNKILEEVVKNNINDRDFFIEKGIGWVLREYSKFNKEWVNKFIENNELRPLSKREASKYLG